VNNTIYNKSFKYIYKVNTLYYFSKNYNASTLKA